MSHGMQIEERTFFRRWDFNLALVILALNIIGLINLYSATHGQDSTEFNRIFISQMLWLGAGWLAFFLISIVDYKLLQKMAYPIFALNLAFLLLVQFFGKRFYGAKRWLDLGFFHYQPSETVKIALILVLAKILQKYSSQEGLSFKDLFKPAVVTGLAFGLIVVQPDLGTALLLVAIAGSMVLFVGVKKHVLVSSLVLIAISLPLAWNFGLKPYQKSRVLTFLDPGRDPRGAGYNSIQSKIAVGSGQVFGKGFRAGTQSQLEFLPERHTDFIYSVLSEEHGFVGSATTLGLFIVLFTMSIRIASRAREKYGALIVVGITSYIFWHMFINIGMVTGLLPIVGVPLPLISYGGTATISTMLGLGIISSVALRRYLF